MGKLNEIQSGEILAMETPTSQIEAYLNLARLRLAMSRKVKGDLVGRRRKRVKFQAFGEKGKWWFALYEHPVK